MTPFQQCRVWFRRASISERSTTVVVLLAVVAVAGWLVAPVNRGSRVQTVSSFGGANLVQGGGAPGAQQGAGGAAVGSGGGSPSASGPVGGSESSGNSGSGAGAAGSTSAPRANPVGGSAASGSGPAGGTTSAQCPPGTDQGITATQVNLAVTIINIAGSAGNGTVGVPTPQEQQNDWQWVADSINDSGGAGCRKLVLHFFQVNPVDSNNAQQQCLAIAASHPFLTVDTGSLIAVGASDCIPQQKIPMVGFGLSKNQLKNYYPYYISPQDIIDDTLRNGVLAFKQLGYFTPAKGFSKLGLLFHSCLTDPPAVMKRELHGAGIPDNQVMAYDLGCPPGGQDSPADLEQAVLTFKNGGVTTVTEVEDGNFAQFTKVAQQQSFKPRYILADDAIAGGGGSLQPDPDNLSGAIDVVASRYGEQSTPGYQPSGGTARCNSLFAAKGRPSVYKQPDGYGGITCSLLWVVAALIDHTPTAQRSALVSGMPGIGNIDLAYPNGPADFSAVPADSPYGRSSWRSEQFVKSCACWQITDRTYHQWFS